MQHDWKLSVEIISPDIHQGKSCTHEEPVAPCYWGDETFFLKHGAICVYESDIC